MLRLTLGLVAVLTMGECGVCGHDLPPLVSHKLSVSKVEVVGEGDQNEWQWVAEVKLESLEGAPSFPAVVTVSKLKFRDEVSSEGPGAADFSCSAPVLDAANPGFYKAECFDTLAVGDSGRIRVRTNVSGAYRPAAQTSPSAAGLLESPEALVGAVQRYVDDPKVRERLAEAGVRSEDIKAIGAIASENPALLAAVVEKAASNPTEVSETLRRFGLPERQINVIFEVLRGLGFTTSPEGEGTKLEAAKVVAEEPEAAVLSERAAAAPEAGPQKAPYLPQLCADMLLAANPAPTCVSWGSGITAMAKADFLVTGVAQNLPLSNKNKYTFTIKNIGNAAEPAVVEIANLAGNGEETLEVSPYLLQCWSPGQWISDGQADHYHANCSGTLQVGQSVNVVVTRPVAVDGWATVEKPRACAYRLAFGSCGNPNHPQRSFTFM